MRLILILWFVPMALFWGWYALSVNDISFGYAMLSRDVHDIVFQIYARTLGVEVEALPGMIAGACALDTALIMCIAAFRWRGSWYPQAKEVFQSYWQEEGTREDFVYEDEFTGAASGRVHPAE